MTTKQLEKDLLLWQARLRLMDWEITCKFAKELRSNAYGECQSSPRFMEAHVFIREDLTDKEITETLVHELLHVRFPNHNESYHNIFSGSTLIGNEFEIGIEMVARALVVGYK